MPQHDTDKLKDIAHRARSIELTKQIGRIDLDNLANEVSEVGADVVWWGMLANEAATDVEAAKLHVETVKAQQGKTYRERMSVMNPSTRVTEAMVTEHLALDATVQSAQALYLDAFERAGIMRSTHFALAGKQRILENMAGRIGQDLYARGIIGDPRREHRDDPRRPDEPAPPRRTPVL